MDINTEFLGSHQRQRRSASADIGTSGYYSGGSVFEQVYGGGRAAAEVEPIAGGDPATLVGPKRRLEVRVFADGLEGLLESYLRKLGPYVAWMPSSTALRSRISIGSMSSAIAISSTMLSVAKAAIGAPGAR